MRYKRNVLALAVLVALLAGCSGKSDQKELTAEERTRLYRTAIETARDEELNEAMEILTSPEGDLADLIFDMLGVEAADMTAFAISVSPVNIRAYGIAAIFPAAGREDDVRDGLEQFIDNQKESFHQYLEDQYQVASDARLETLEDGTILLVMCEDQDAVFDAVRDAVEAGE